jgi:hypothetical protein
MACYFSRPALNMAFSSQTPFSVFPPVTRRHGCTLDQSTDISLTTSLSGRGTGGTFVSPRLCAARSAGQIPASLSLNSTSGSNPRHVLRGTKASKCLNAGKLKLPSTSQYFADTLEERLNSIVLDDNDVETAWSTLRNTVYNTAFECLGPSTRKHNDWFDENCAEITQLLEDNHCAYKARIDDPTSTAKKDALRNARSTVQQKLRDMQDSWLNATPIIMS